MNVIFMGTPKIGAVVLQTLIDLKINIVAVICQPDKLVNRKKQIVFSPVKQLCIEHNLVLFQPNKLSEISQQIKELKPDIILTCAFGQFIPTEILDLPTYGCFNIHASLLPKLRGGAPIHWAIINNETKTGVTLMKMILKMDAGDIISQLECDIDQNETYQSLYEKLCQLARQIIINDFHKLENKTINSYPQEISKVSFGYNITKQDQIINFNQPAQNLDCLIRGLYDKPFAIWIYNDIAIKIHGAKLTKFDSTKFVPGKILDINKNGIFVACSDYAIQFTKIQLPNKNPVLVSQLINGNHPFKIDN